MSEVSEQVAASIVFENESVRVWDDRAAPGQTLHLHVHRLPYVTVILSANEARPSTRRAASSGDSTDSDAETFTTWGRVSFRSCMRYATRVPASSRFSSSSY
jgi:hypothetical protein